MITDTELDPERQLRLMILAVQREGSRVHARALRPLGLSPAQAEVLTVLADLGPMSLVDLGGNLVCESGSPSRLVAGLVDRGYLARGAAPGDARRVVLSLTEVGEQTAEEVAHLEVALEASVAAALTPADVDRLLGKLWLLVEGRPVGRALVRRIVGRTPLELPNRK